MKAASSSECSSGCESGWTTYLDQISNSDPYGRGLYADYEEKAYAMYEEDEEEDLSMVSDASSAPQPNSLPYYYYGYAPNEDSNTKTKTTTRTTATRKKKKEPKQQQSLCLDDTASSSIFHFSHSQENVRRTDDHNSAEQVYSAALFQGESVTKKRMSFFKSSTKGKSGNLLGRKKQ